MTDQEIGTEKIAIAIGIGGEVFLYRQYTSIIFFVFIWHFFIDLNMIVCTTAYLSQVFNLRYNVN